MDNGEHLNLRLRSWLRKQGVIGDFWLHSVQDVDGVQEISHWDYPNVPRPDISTIPNLTYEEAFQEIEDIFPIFTADVFVVSADGTITADRRQSLSTLEGNEIVLNMGRYYIHPEPALELRLNGNMTSPTIKVIRDGARLSVSSPSEGQATLVIWKI